MGVIADNIHYNSQMLSGMLNSRRAGSRGWHSVERPANGIADGPNPPTGKKRTLYKRYK